MIVLALLLAGCPPEPDDTGDEPPRPCGDGTCATDESVESCPYDCGFPYLVIVDQGGDPGGGSPGADLDAIRLVRDGEENWVAAVGGSSIGGPGNEWTDPTEIIGPSDSECQGQNFVSLGGPGSWIAVAFDVPVRSGDVLTVYELSAEMCDNGSLNDVWEALVATTPDPTTGEWLVRGAGLGEFEVPPF